MQFVVDALAQLVSRTVVTVNHKHVRRGRWQRLKPGHQLVAISVSRCRLKLNHLGPHRDVLTMHAQGRYAAGQQCTTGARGLVTGQDDHVAVVRQVVDQVVQHPATGGHAAGRQDDFGAVLVRNGLRFIGCTGHGGGVLHRLALFGRQPVFTQVLCVQA